MPDRLGPAPTRAEATPAEIAALREAIRQARAIQATG